MTKLLAEHVLTHPGQVPAIARSSVEVERGLITALNPATVGGEGLLMMPALVNAHDHGHGQRPFAFGAGDQALELWLSLLPLEPIVDPYLRAAAAFARLAASGVGTINHCHSPQRPWDILGEATAVSRAALDVGVRVAFGVPLRDRNHAVYGSPDLIATRLGDADFASVMADETTESAARQLARVETIAALEHSLFGVQYSPAGPEWCSDALLEGVAEASERHGRRIHMHLLETRIQREWADAHYPDGLIRRLDEIGLLSERLTVAHGVWLSEDECELLAARGVTVTVNVSSNLRLASGMAPVHMFAAKKLAWAMGLDGMALDDDEDALRELRILWLSHKGSGLRDGINQAQLCEAALVVGRQTVTPVPGGSIAPGMAADLLVLNYGRMSCDIMSDAAEKLDVVLSRARKEHVHQLMVDGRLIVEDGKVRSVDLTEIEFELHNQARMALRDSATSSRLRHRHRDALAEFYGCGCHREAKHYI